jgi:predicted DNA-binding transcriptional regulator YafY
MNRIDRLLGYILELQGRRRLTAAALAARFEVSTRTVYRDLEALAELGVPIVATPGHGYSLEPGYHLPPVMFTADEAGALSLAAGLFRHFVAHEGRAAVDAALRKVDAVLPEATREEVAERRRRICLTSWPHRAAPLDAELPRLLQQAMAERRRLAITYYSRSTGERQERKLDPHALVYYAGDWHLLAYCHERKDERQFRLSRMEAPRLLDEQFTMPDDVDARQFWANAEPHPYGNRVAHIRFPRETARWARERRHYAWESETESEAGLEVTLRVEQWSEVLGWLLSWGGAVTVLSPPALRALLREEGQRITEANSEE